MRYIDADKLIDKIFPIGLLGDGKYTINAKAVKVAIDKMPTADVVPKSEVEKLNNILDSYALQYGTVMDKHIVIEKARVEVAREIFEEIEKLNNACVETGLFQGAWFNKSKFDKGLAELKKKYTKEE